MKYVGGDFFVFSWIFLEFDGVKYQCPDFVGRQVFSITSGIYRRLIWNRCGHSLVSNDLCFVREFLV